MKPLLARGLDGFSWIEHGFGTRDAGAWTPPERTARLHQVHGSGVVGVARPGDHGDGDALITGTPDLWLEIRTADCVPVLLADPERRVVAAIHAGWRGTAATIAQVTVDALRREWGCQPDELYAAIGPAIGACCFAVGEEVAAHFPGHITRQGTAIHADLVGANRQQLLGAGVAAERIGSLALCTACDPSRFHSFRRDRGEGRLVAAIRIVPAE